MKFSNSIKINKALDLHPNIFFEFGRDFAEIFANFDSLSGVWYTESEEMIIR